MVTYKNLRSGRNVVYRVDFLPFFDTSELLRKGTDVRYTIGNYDALLDGDIVERTYRDEVFYFQVHINELTLAPTLKPAASLEVIKALSKNNP